jgi:hypothetical protein
VHSEVEFGYYAEVASSTSDTEEQLTGQRNPMYHDTRMIKEKDGTHILIAVFARRYDPAIS